MSQSLTGSLPDSVLKKLALILLILLIGKLQQKISKDRNQVVNKLVFNFGYTIVSFLVR